MQLKILSLNIRRYFEWDNRKGKLLKLLKDKNPDLIMLQETIFDPNQSSKNQVAEIAELLPEFKYNIFTSTWLKFSQRWKILDKPLQIWQWVLSKFELYDIESIFLKKEDDDREKRVLENFSIMKDWIKIPFTNIHFSNSDTLAEKHLKETLEIFSERWEPRIMAWDFNIKDLNLYSDLFSSTYHASSEEFSYMSYPSKDESLDYVLLPKWIYFEKFECINVGVSDHLALYLEIKI